MIEAVIATAIVVMVSGSLYLGAISLLKLEAASKVAIEANALGIQKLEDIVAGGFENIISTNFVPLQTQTTQIYFANTSVDIIRQATVTGHAADKSVTTDLTTSAYLEVRVDISYPSVFSNHILSNTYSTLVINQ